MVPDFGDLIETAALLATQPVPAGGTVAIVSNIGGAGVLTADACTDLGLTVHRPHAQIRRTAADAILAAAKSRTQATRSSPRTVTADRIGRPGRCEIPAQRSRRDERTCERHVDALYP